MVLWVADPFLADDFFFAALVFLDCFAGVRLFAPSFLFGFLVEANLPPDGLFDFTCFLLGRLFGTISEVYHRTWVRLSRVNVPG